MNKQIPIQMKMVNSIDSIPIEIFEWGRFPDHFRIDMPHRHDFDEILFFIKGGGIHEIDFKEYEIEDYSIHFIPRSAIHFLKRNIYSDGFTIAFRSEYLEYNNIHSFYSPIQDLQSKKKSFVLNLEKSNFSEILNLTKILQKQIKRSKGYYKQKCFLLSLELLYNSIAQELLGGSSRKSDETLKNDSFNRFENLVSDNVHMNMAVSWYAKQLCLSPNYLSNLVKKESGKSAKQHIIDALLIMIKKRLLNTNQSIKQIAYDHAIDESRLGKMFKKNVGYTMSNYRSFENSEL